MDIIIFLIIISIFVLEIHYALKNDIKQDVIGCCLIFFVFFSLSIIKDIPIPYEGVSESEFSSEVAFFIGKIAYYIGRFFSLIILVIISSIPIFKYKKSKSKERLKKSDKNDDEIDYYVEEKKYCIYCNTELGNYDKFCYKCGKEQLESKEIEKVHCVKCGKEANKSWKFCKYCGEKLD